MNVDKIVTSQPINKTAGIVTKRGVHFNPTLPESTIKIYDILPQIRKPTRIELKNPRFVNLLGVRVGHFTVIGISTDIPKRWVLKCDCGKYEMRTAKAIKTVTGKIIWKCQYCLKTQKIINRNRRYQKWIDFGAVKKEDQ